MSIRTRAPRPWLKSTTNLVGRSWICSIRDRLSRSRPLGSRVLRSSGTGEIRRGWIQVRASTASVSGLLTYKQWTTGIEVSVEPAELGDRFALFVEESGDVGAGVAVFKPEASPSIQLRVRDEAGSDPLEEAFVSRGNFHQRALTLPEWFDEEWPSSPAGPLSRG